MAITKSKHATTSNYNYENNQTPKKEYVFCVPFADRHCQ